MVAFWALKGYDIDKILNATELEKVFYYATMEAEMERQNKLAEVNPLIGMM